MIAFSDIEDSTAHNEKLGDREWVKVLERHNRLIEKLVADHGGHVVKAQGDGFMIAFADTEQAVLCGIGIQRALLKNAKQSADIRVRIGIHIGPSVRRGDDLWAQRRDGRPNRRASRRRRNPRQRGGTRSGRRLPNIDLSEPREAELKGLQGTHQLYAVKVPA